MKLRRTLAVAAAALTALALAACSGGDSANTGSGGSGGGGGALTIGSNLELTSFDPAQAQEGPMLFYWQAVYDTLLYREPNGDIEPMLATEWSYNDDNTELTLKLRDDVTFSDGAKFDADAVKANIEHFQTAGGPQGSTMGAVESVDVVDAATVKLNLSAPDPAMLIYLTNAGGMMGSPEALGTDDIKTKPVGSGPYTLDASTVIGSEYVYAKKADYWNADLQHYDKISVKVIPDTTALFNALVSGQVDVAPLDAKSATNAEEKGMVAHNQQLDWRGFLLYDRGGKVAPALGDVRVRQAINMAIDKESILKSVEQGRGELTSQIFGPNSTAYIEDLEDPYPYDPEKAKQLIAEAGYPDGFSLQMPIASGLFDSTMLAVVEEQLGAVGITVDYVDIAPADLFGEMTSGKFPMTWMSLFRPSTWVNIQQTIAPEALWNATHYEDPKVDALIKDIQFAPDVETETAKAQELNQYVIDQAWFAPWYAPDWLLYSNDKVDVQLQAEQAMPSIYNYSPAK